MGFKNVSLGFIFFIDFRIGGIDILPDIVGYILIIYGLKYLAEESQYFLNARKLSIPLAFFSIFDIFQAQSTANTGSVLFAGFISMILGILITVLYILMVYNLCIGVAEKARMVNDFQFEKTALDRWKYFIIYEIIVFAMTFFGVLGIPLFLILFIPAFIFAIVIIVLMIDLFSQADKRFS